MSDTFIIGISGGSGSGKTFVANILAQKLGAENCLLIEQDSYYFDQSQHFDHDGGSVNFDHPNAIDFDLLAEHLNKLKEGKDIEIPVYDFATHKRLNKVVPANPKKVVIVDGILILHHEHVRKHFNESLFVFTPETVRFERRLNRDVIERGRTKEGVVQQFEKQVKPMHDKYVEPCKEFATLVGHGDNMQDCDKTIESLLERIVTYH